MEVFKNKLIMIKDKSFKYEKKINSSTDVIDFSINTIEIQKEPEEVMILYGMDAKNNLIGFCEVSRGSLSATMTTGREVFKRAVVMNCSKIILVHNHPTDDCTPSGNDYMATERLKNISELFGIELLDHIIITEKECYSILADRKVKE